MWRLVRAIAAYRNVPRSPLSQNMRLGTCAVTKAQTRMCKCEDLSEPSLLTEMCQDPLWARTWDLVQVLWLRLRQDCANVKTCQSLPCLHKCAKIAIWARTWDLVQVLWLRLRQDCANVKTWQSLPCLHKCAKIAIWASTWDLVHVLWLRLRRECANVKTCQSHRCLHKLRWNRPTTAQLEVFYSSDYMRFMSPFPCLIMVC